MDKDLLLNISAKKTYCGHPEDRPDVGFVESAPLPAGAALPLVCAYN